MVKKVRNKRLRSVRNQSVKGFNNPSALLRSLGLDSNISNQGAHKSFKTRVPPQFMARMQIGNPDDPLLRQVLPISAELFKSPGYCEDPLGEQNSSPISGVLHKYQGRILVILSGTCAINCRYCFRRHFPYQQQILRQRSWPKLLAYIKADPSITEVIYSGGDPLLVGQEKFLQLSQAIVDTGQIKTLRIHSRLPIVSPERIDDRFIDLLAAINLRKVLVVHVNHPNEIGQPVVKLMQKFRLANITLLNQTVLLKGVNDKTDTLVALSEKLFSAGILPYYLHLLDKVQGGAHFEVEIAQAKQLYWQIMQRLPGYLVPKLVREEASAPCKMPICFS